MRLLNPFSCQGSWPHPLLSQEPPCPGRQVGEGVSPAHDADLTIRSLGGEIKTVLRRITKADDVTPLQASGQGPPMASAPKRLDVSPTDCFVCRNGCSPAAPVRQI